MKVFSFTDYREVLKAIVSERKPLDRGFGFHALADAARVQRPYMSKVIGGSADLSNDQLFLIARFLKLNEAETEYLQLLLDYERTGVAERKKLLAERIASFIEQQRDSSVYLRAKTIDGRPEPPTDMTDYYLDPLVQIAHIALSIEHFSKNPMALASELHVSGTQLHSIIETLERLGLASRQDGIIVVHEPHLHLSKSSPLYRSWLNQLKVLSMTRLQQLPNEDIYSFTSIFSADLKTRKIIHDRFLEFLKSCEDLVRKADPKQTYQLSFDIFPWTTPSP